MARKLPTTLGACVDLYYSIRSSRLEVEKKVKEMKENEAALEEHIFQMFKKSDLDGAKGKAATAAITHSIVPHIEDHQKFFDYVLKTKEIDLMEKRASTAACRERWEAGVTIPGVEKFDRIGLSVTKLSKEK